MSAASSSFSAVKLSSGLVNQARDAASPMRRSVAGQIEYWATLGRIAEASGLLPSDAEFVSVDLHEAHARSTSPIPNCVLPKRELWPKRFSQPSRPRRWSRSSGLA